MKTKLDVKPELNRRWLITLQDVNNDEMIAAFDITDVEGEIMEYYYYYFEGYENFMTYLLRRGAKNCDDSLLDKKYQNADIVTIPIYEVPKREG